MRQRLFIGIGAFITLGVFVRAQPSAPGSLDVPMDRKIRTMLITFGNKAKEEQTWKGTYRVTPGEIIATEGWRFTGNDYATTTGFSLTTRRFFPRFWKKRGRDKGTLPLEPNGVLLSMRGVTRESVLEVNAGDEPFSVQIGVMGYGGSRWALNREVEVARLPTARLVVEAPTEDTTPCALETSDGGLQVAYIAFTHGEGFARRPPVKEAPEDFSFLAKPTGGDQIMFTEFAGEEWSPPAPVTPGGGEILGLTMARDGEGRAWVIWAANVDSNWDIYGAALADNVWTDATRLTDAPVSDGNVTAIADSEGTVWIAWQRLNGTGSDILVAPIEDGKLGDVTTVSSGSGNAWKPALSAGPEGRVAVAWDSYAKGDYDVVARIRKANEWSEARTIAGSARNELRASVAYDPQGRLWIAYEVCPEGWGKDFGPYDRSPKRTSLYRAREVGLRVLDGNALMTVPNDVNLALPLPNGKRRWPKAKRQILATGPKVSFGHDGRLWLSARIRYVRFDSAVGGTWMNVVTALDPESMKWRVATTVPGTDGFLHEEPALIPGPGSGLRVLSASDGRLRAGAVFGIPRRKTRRTGKTVPPRSTRTYTQYPDWLFNKEISLADTGPVARISTEYTLVPVEEEALVEPVPEAGAEAEDVAAIRDYRATVRGTPLRILRGEFHRHTELSGDGAGDGTLYDMWRYGIDMAALDWIGSGDHDNGGGREFTWWITQKTTSLFGMPGTFTPMYTYERSCVYPDGHRNAVFATLSAEFGWIKRCS
ncbi:MAG: hypothetical protein HN742_40330 [Lentisphaerae bacterium]|jgi:hypothetical protein|nr:hypothetical protein [Lentisphaerota bacterium]MBT4817843.1 hypothetical protein [Lentisphaerota bacterium]MBT5604778.1 hypothetical protein [Lentisphaerota bacterium]MBT7060573.1 hypothetical protein [Lentisphaerota bacterium]MBT7848184.1 hypothetical protein [Lentisphaerota bacterium]